MSAKLSRLPEMLSALYGEIPGRNEFLVDRSRWSYRDLQDSIAKSRELFRETGFTLGGRIVIAGSDRYHVAVLYFSCLLEGVAAVVLDPQSSASEFTLLLERSKPDGAFVDQSIIDRAERLQREDSGFPIFPIAERRVKKTPFSLIIRKQKDDPSSGGGTFPAVLERFCGVKDPIEVPEDTAGLILYTSGTSSMPKGVVLNHRNLQTQMQIFIDHFRLDRGSGIANHLPLHHSDGLNQGPLLAAVVGGRWISAPPLTMQSLGGFLDVIFRERATHLITVPTVLAMICRLSEEYDDSFSSEEFQFVESTAGYLSEALWEKFEERFGTRIVNCYGLTETVCEATYCGPGDGFRKRGTVGKPLGCEVRLEKEADNDLMGELWLRGDIVMDRYFENPEATADSFSDGWFKTGDIAVIDDEGFVSIVGRKSSTIVRGGLNVYPEDVTKVLQDLPGVESAATIGLDDEILGERVVSCLTTTSDAVTVEALFAHCREHLAKEKVPNDIHILEQLPYGPSGKVDLKELRETVRQGGGAGLSSRGTGESVEEAVLEIAASVFNVSGSQLSSSSDPSNTEGWDSLAFLELVMSLEKSFGITIPPKEIMTIQALGDAVRVVTEQKKAFALSS